MPHIYWTAFTWEAFATLAVGIAAVGAAYVVGSRQAGIAEGQRRILARQVGLDDLKLRSELFDRRFAVYEATRRLLADVMRTANSADPDSERGFLIALDQSTFLFRPSVRAALENLWAEYCRLGAVTSTMTANFERSGDYGAELIEAKHRLLLDFNEMISHLSDVFGDELRLGQDDSVPGPEGPMQRV